RMNREVEMRRAAMFLLLVTLAGPARAAAHKSPPGLLEAGIDLARTEEALNAGDLIREFELMQMRNLWVRVKVPKLDRSVRLNLTLTSPRGDVFYEVNRTFGRVPRDTMSPAPGGKSSITTFQARRIAGGWGLDLPVPIAGNVFQRYPTPGVWRVAARLSGS